MIVRYRGIFCGHGHKRRVIQNEQGSRHLLYISPAISFPVRSGDVQGWQRRCQGFSTGHSSRWPDVSRKRLPCCTGRRGCGCWSSSGTGSWRVVRISSASPG